MFIIQLTCLDKCLSKGTSGDDSEIIEMGNSRGNTLNENTTTKKNGGRLEGSSGAQAEAGEDEGAVVIRSWLLPLLLSLGAVACLVASVLLPWVSVKVMLKPNWARKIYSTLTSFKTLTGWNISLQDVSVVPCALASKALMASVKTALKVFGSLSGLDALLVAPILNMVDDATYLKYEPSLPYLLRFLVVCPGVIVVAMYVVGWLCSCRSRPSLQAPIVYMAYVLSVVGLVELAAVANSALELLAAMDSMPALIVTARPAVGLLLAMAGYMTLAIAYATLQIEKYVPQQ